MIYPVYWQHSVTVYHRAISPDGTITYTRFYADGCSWKTTSASNRSNGHTDTGTRHVCRFRIPAPVLGIGDIIIKGKVTDTVDEFTSGSRSTDILNKYNGKCFVIAGLHDNSQDNIGIRHIYTDGAE